MLTDASTGYRPLSRPEQFEAIEANLASRMDAPTALGACIFAGGFSFGLEEAGFDVVGHLELPDLDLGTRVSRQRWPVANAPLDKGYAHGDGDEVKRIDTWLGFIDRLIKTDNAPDMFYANPPCVAYAGIGAHKGNLDDRMCYVRYCAYESALRLQPKVWAWELVPGIHTKDPALIDAMAYRASRSGYRSYVFLTSSANHGGYQDRRRFHFIASKVELDFDGTYAAEPPERKTWLTLGDALEKAEAARLAGSLANDEFDRGASFKPLLPFTAPGSHLMDLPDAVMHGHYKPRGKDWTGSGRPGFAHMRGRLDLPSPNVLGGSTIAHPISDRYLSARESATIMGFPMDFEFSHGTKAYQEIGRGLCTHNAAFLGRVIARGLQAGVQASPTKGATKGREDSYVTVVDWRSMKKISALTMAPEKQREWYSSRYPGQPVPDGYGSRRAAAVEDEDAA